MLKTDREESAEFRLDATKRMKSTYSFSPASLTKPTLFGYFINLERRFQASKVERSKTTSLAAEEMTFSSTRITVIVVGLYR